MRISSNEIKKLVEKILSSQNEFFVDEDYYWEVPPEYVFDLYHQPTNLDVGQLSDDLKELQELLDDKRESILHHDLAHLSQLLRAISLKL